MALAERWSSSFRGLLAPTPGEMESLLQMVFLVNILGQEYCGVSFAGSLHPNTLGRLHLAGFPVSLRDVCSLKTRTMGTMATTRRKSSQRRLW